MSPFRVLTLNIWNRNDPWEPRLHAIREGVQTLRPDIVGLQEVLHPTSGAEAPDQAALIAAGLGYEVLHGAAWHTGGIEFGNAVLSRFPIVRSEVFKLPRLDTDETRCLVFAELDAPFAKVPFFVTHLNWKLDQGYVREAQVRAIAGHVAACAPASGFPPVLVGDFNAEPDSNEMRFLRGLAAIDGKSTYFSDAFARAGDGSPGHTFSVRNPFAADLREPDRRIDYILVGGPDREGRGEPIEARVCLDEPVQGVYPTDHFGVTALLRVRA